MIRESVYKNEISMCGLYAYGRLAVRTPQGYIWNEPSLHGYCVVATAQEFFDTAAEYRNTPADNTRMYSWRTV